MVSASPSKADISPCLKKVRYGAYADILRRNRHARFTPESSATWNVRYVP
jgi:hypothetical protein